MTATHAREDAQVNRISSWMRRLVEPDQFTEVRVLQGRSAAVRSAVFAGDKLDDLARYAARAAIDSPQGIYWTPNPVKSQRLSGQGGTATDADVVKRNWLLIDVDPKRPADCSATNDERNAAWQVAYAVQSTLESSGFADVLTGDSGNGWHIMVPIDLPNDSAQRDAHKAFLGQLKTRFDTSSAEVDGRTFNAARIWKLYGTTARKGEHSDERPHRLTRVVTELPDELRGLRRHASANAAAFAKLMGEWNAQTASAVRRPTDVNDRAAVIKRAIAYVDKEPPAVSGQRGHDRAFHVACVLWHGFGLSDLECFEAIQCWNMQCQPPWSEKELRHKIASAKKAPADKPRGYLLGETATPAAKATVPAPKMEEPEPWEPPIPLNDMPTVPEFPLDVFPPLIRMFVREVAWATDSPVDFVASMLLAFAGGAIGNSRWLAITRTHLQPPCLFAVAVGRPGSGKSPAFRELKRPFVEAEMRFEREYKQESETWRSSGGESPKPVQRRLLTEDFTVEGLLKVLSENPRGMLLARNEIRGMLTSMNQYRDGGKGQDRQVILQLWDCETISIDRKGNLDGIPIRVSRAFCGIVGTIQPSVVGELRQDDGKTTDDGFIDRFLVSYPNPVPFTEETWREVSTEAQAAWRSCVDELLAMPMRFDESGKRKPHKVFLSADGRAVWTEFTRAHAAEMNASDFPEHLIGAWSKLKGYCGRIALILRCLQEAFEPALALEVDGDDLKRAWLVIDYFKAHTRRVMSAMGADERVAKAQKVLAWIQKLGTDTFSRRDAYRDLQSESRFPKPESLDAPLRLLAALQHIREIETERKATGRKPTQKFQVNPLTRQSQNRQNRRNESADQSSGGSGGFATDKKGDAWEGEDT